MQKKQLSVKNKDHKNMFWQKVALKEPKNVWVKSSTPEIVPNYNRSGFFLLSQSYYDIWDLTKIKEN